MAILISKASGDFTSGSIWQEALAAGYSNTHPASTGTYTVTTTEQNSATFTPNASVNAILLKVASRAASPNGELVVRVYNNTTTNLVIQKSVNISSIPTDCKGWIMWDFSSSPVTLANTTHRFTVQTTVSNQVSLFGTSSTYSRALRKTGTYIVSAGDQFIICGDIDTTTTYTIDHDITSSANTYGFLEVGHLGVWKWKTAASTNYYFKTSGNILFGSGSEVYIGDTTTALPSTSTATIEVVPATNAAVGIYALSNSKIVTRAALQPTPIAQLTADVAASGTTLTTDISTGWKSGQTLLIAGTGAVTQYEEKALSADATGTSVPVAAVTHAHTGTGATRAHVGNITRSIVIKGTSTSLNTFFYAGPSALTVLDFEYTKFENMGANVATKYGVVVDGFSSSADAKFVGCVYENFTVAGSRQLDINSASIINCKVEDCIFYNVNGLHFTNPTQTVTSSNLILKNILAVRNTSSTQDSFSLTSKSWQINDIYLWNFTNVAIYGYTVNPVGTAYAQDGNFDYKWDNLQCHMSAGQGMRILRSKNYDFGKLEFSKLRAQGYLFIVGCELVSIDEIIMTTNENNTNGIRVQDGISGLVKIGKFTFNGNSFAGTTAITLLNSIVFEIDEYVCSNAPSPFGLATSLVPNSYVAVKANKVTFTSVSGDGGIGTNPNNYVKWGNYNAANAFRHIYSTGTIRSDTTEFRTASPSVRMGPTSATVKLKGLEKFIAVADGTSATVKVWVKKSSTYNGNQVQLMLKKDSAAGVSVDTELTVSTSASNNAWEELSATLPTASSDAVYTVYLTCDGTTGFVYYDDWSVT
jgi:hypothetical protein